MPEVAIVILNYNGKHFLEQFLPSLVRHTPAALAEIIIADNASRDGSVEFLKKNYPGLKILSLDRNFGFAEGYNRAFSRLKHPYYLLLNSDVEVSPNWLEPLLELFHKNPKLGACMPAIKSYDNKDFFEYAGASGGFIDRYGYTFCRGRIFGKVEKDEGQYQERREVFWTTGACMLIAAEAYRKAGGMDAHFFAHMEEVDLCWRLHKLGYTIFVEPASKVFHVGGGTLPQQHPWKTFLNYRNNLLLLHKNLPEQSRKKILRYRIMLDYLSALRFINSPKHIGSIFKAHRAYRKMKKKYNDFLTREAKTNILPACSLVYRGSVVWAYYIQGEKTFSSLNI